MKLSDLTVGSKHYTQLGHRVLAVLSRRVEGYSVYVGAVEGKNHDLEYLEVARSGDKQSKPIAEAIAKNLFHPAFEIDLSYID